MSALRCASHARQVFRGASASGVIDRFDEQVNIFRNAKIIIGLRVPMVSPLMLIPIGPHGAGLSNMLYAPKDASVIEFPMKPHCNRCFGYMAMGLELDYWMVPQVTCNYHLNYEMNQGRIDAIIRALHHVIQKKGLGHLISSDFELPPAYFEDDAPAPARKLTDKKFTSKTTPSPAVLERLGLPTVPPPPPKKKQTVVHEEHVNDIDEVEDVEEEDVEEENVEEEEEYIEEDHKIEDEELDVASDVESSPPKQSAQVRE